jgi:release factor glutamine methyltransferase
MQQTETWTIGRLLTWTTDFLKKRGAESPRLDAEVLLAHARGCQRIQLYTAFDEEPAEEARVAFRELVRRRAEGTPVAYLVGRREFYSLSFQVTPDVLIPRPETEFLLIALLDLAKQHQGELAIADIGTGSGCVAVCAARHLPQSRVTAIDISPAALAVARKNAAEHGVEERIEFIESDLLATLEAERRFDFIVSNPPYVKTAELERLSRDVKDHEPRLALDGGPSGVAVIERLVPQAGQRLSAGGWLLMEIGPAIDSTVRELITAAGVWELAPTKKDLAGHARVIVARRKPA